MATKEGWLEYSDILSMFRMSYRTTGFESDAVRNAVETKQTFPSEGYKFNTPAIEIPLAQ
jgi:hypothetical protein